MNSFMSNILAYPKMIALFLLMLATTAAFNFGVIKPIQFDETVADLSRDVGFVLNDMQINGIQETRRSDILARLDLDNGIPMLAIDLAAMQVALESLPWVKHANITRELPGKLVIDIIERQPFALWQRNGKVRLIDETGTVITGKGLSRFSHLVLLVGVGADHGAFDLSALVASNPDLAGRVRSAVRVDERRWDLIFDNGIRLKLPEEEVLDKTEYSAFKAWKKFISLQDEYRLLSRDVSVIDMRVKGRLVMRVSPEAQRALRGQEWVT